MEEKTKLNEAYLQLGERRLLSPMPRDKEKALWQQLKSVIRKEEAKWQN